MSWWKIVRVVAGLGVLVLVMPPPAAAQNPKIVPCPAEGQDLLEMPVIHRTGDAKLQATLKLTNGERILWGDPGDDRCAKQQLRYLSGFAGFDPGAERWPDGADPLPGPTFRSRVGDLVQIAFFNQIDTKQFASTLDRNAAGTSAGCDQTTISTSPTASSTTPSGFAADKMPNCLHGSSTSNVHFHGTHTTPSTTGDNIFLFVRPAQRKDGQLQPSEADARPAFDRIFDKCAQEGPPQQWADLGDWTTTQMNLIQEYDRTAPYQGKPGNLPPDMQLWPANQKAIDDGEWPQYQIGAYPYCFPLPKYEPGKYRMGQAPGTHWYHAHKHGSTALNVANGLTGVFIVEGQYDDDLRKYYPQLEEQVLMIQQLSTVPFARTNPAAQPKPGAPRPPLSVNGRRNPVVSMQRGEVQLWRIVNGTYRDSVELVYFEPQQQKACAGAAPSANSPAPQWRQIAQDGVQFAVENYRTVGAVNNSFNLGAANRADLLVKAPTRAGRYTLCVVRNIAPDVQPSADPAKKPDGAPDDPSALLTVEVGDPAVAMEFIPDAQFPAFPPFLHDVTDDEIQGRKRTLVFGAGSTTIDGKSFMDHTINQTMQLNTAEEWTVMNQANDKAHPFHIHINPFQITEIFQPNSPEALDPKSPCYVNPSEPSTFKPCPSQQPPAPWVWWDVFPIPTAQQVTLTSCTKKEDCPEKVRPYITGCTAATATAPASCTETIPGWFKMRSRFVDFTGQYVLHCHILIHEDRGMMQGVQVVTDTTPYGHH